MSGKMAGVSEGWPQIKNAKAAFAAFAFLIRLIRIVEDNPGIAGVRNYETLVVRVLAMFENAWFRPVAR